MKRNIKKQYRTVLAVLLTMLMIASGFGSANISKNRPGLLNKERTVPISGEETLTVIIPVGSYEVRKTTQGDEVFVEDFGRLLVLGKPNLPSKIFAVAIPPGAEVAEVSFDSGEGIVRPGSYEIAPVPLPRVIGEEDPGLYERDKKMFEDNFNSVYGSDDPYPVSVVEFVRSAGYRKYNLVDVRVTPFTYYPVSGQLVYYPEVTVYVSYMFPESGGDDLMVDSLVRTERIAEEIIVNYDQAQDWNLGTTGMGKGLYDFVIITLDSLTSYVTSLVNWEISKSRTVNVVTTDWIDSNYNGYDLAEKMRNFLRDKYPSGEWGIEDVLLVGHYDDVPMRRCWQDLGYGKPETDYYYAELSLPDSESWDADGDHRWGEDSDPIDFYAEVNVGRIPWSSSSTVSSICQKSVDYEQNEDPSFKKNILLLGAFFWPDTDNAVLMEAKVDQPWMSDWTMTRMYEDAQSSYPCDYDLNYNNVKSVWSSGTYAFVDWAGHGSPTACYEYYPSTEFVDTDTCNYLNDDYPAIIFADACSNSDTDYLNIGQAMLEQGGVGFLGATKVSFGMPGWNNPYSGSSQSLDYFFTTCVTSGDYTQGQAHQWALLEMYTNGLWYYVKYEMFEWGALWGNPNLAMAPVLINDPPVFSNENPLDGQIDVPITISSLNITIEDPEGDSFDWSIETSPDIGSSSGTGEYNGTKICNVSGLSYNTTYTWYVNATDSGSGEITEEVYTFTTNVAYVTRLEYGWNLFSVLFNQTLGDLVFVHNGTEYSWSEAVSAGIIYGVIYRFVRSSQSWEFLYELDDVLACDHGYWIKVFEMDIDVWCCGAPSDVGNCTTLTKKPGDDYGWNLFSVCCPATLGDLVFIHNDTSYTWSEAGSEGIIYPVIYRFVRSSQEWEFLYELDDVLMPDHGYWIKVFETNIRLC